MICREMGWSLVELEAMPADRYDILVEWLQEVFDARTQTLNG